MEKKIILCPLVIKKEVEEIILQKNSKIENEKVLTVSEFVEYYLLEDFKKFNIINTYKKIIQSKFPDHKLVNDKSFFEKLYDLVLSLKINKKRLNDINEDDYFYPILSEVFDLKIMVDNIDKIKNNISSLDVRYIGNSLYSDLEYYFIKNLKIKEEKDIVIKLSNNTIIEKNNFKNITEEIEYIARNHQENYENIKITICGKEYSGLIKMIFEQYNIPVLFSSEISLNTIKSMYLSILNYIKDSSQINIDKLITSKFMIGNEIKENYKYTNKTFENIKNYRKIFGAKCLNENDEKEFSKIFIDKSGKEISDKNFIKYSKYTFILENYYGVLNDIIEKSTLAEQIKLIDKYISNSVNTAYDRDSLNLIRDAIKENLYYVNDEDIISVINLIDNINFNEKLDNAVKIYNFGDAQKFEKYSYLLGYTTNNINLDESVNIFSHIYEKLDLNNGIEKLNKIKSILEHYEQTTSNLIISYPSSNLSGKEQFECSLIKKYNEINTLKKLLENDLLKDSYIRDYKLSESDDIYKNKNNEILISVSSLEKYIHCNLSYFLEKGLGLYESNMGYSVADEGNNYHKILELLYSDDEFLSIRKKYISNNNEGKELLEDIHKEIIEEISKKVLDAYFDVYKGIKGSEMIKKEMVDNIVSLLKSDFSLELDSKLLEEDLLLEKEKLYSNIIKTPSYIDDVLEAEGIKNIFKEYNIRFTGFADKVIKTKDSISIVDYKRSEKKFKSEDFFKGLSLQLPSYIIFENLENRSISFDRIESLYVTIKRSKKGQYNRFKFNDNISIEDYWILLNSIVTQMIKFNEIRKTNCEYSYSNNYFKVIINNRGKEKAKDISIQREEDK